MSEKLKTANPDSEMDTSEFLSMWEAKTLANLVSHINGNDGETKDSIFSILDSIDIKNPDHLAIFDAIKSLHRNCITVNQANVEKWLKEKKIEVRESRLRSIFHSEDKDASKLIHKLNTIFDPLPENESEGDQLISNMRTMVSRPKAKPASTHPDNEVGISLSVPLKQLIKIVESHGYRVTPIGKID